MSLWLLLLLHAIESHNSSFYLVTLHDKPNNVLKYDASFKAQGNLIQSSSKLDELRGMTVNQDFVYVCNAHASSSKVVRVPKCGGEAIDFITENISHPYDLAVDATADLIFVSNQDTGTVTSYNLITGAFLSVFASVADPRGVEIDLRSNVFVSSESLNAVLAFSQGGQLLWSLPCEDPIGLATGLLSDGTEVLFVGSNDDSSKSRYLSFNLTAFHLNGAPPPLLKTFSDKHLQHPAGVILQNDILFGFDQTGQSLLSWKGSSGEYLGSVLDVSGPPEQIQFVSGCS